MKAFRDLSVRQKLTRVAMATTLVAIATTCAALLFFEINNFRRDTLTEMAVDAQILASNSASALLFQDKEWATRTLASLQAERRSVAAAIYDVNGRPFGVWSRHGGSAEVPARAEPSGHRFEGGDILVFRPIIFEGTEVGTVLVRSDLGELGRRQRLVVLIAGLAALASFGLAVALSTRLHRAITGPILRLAEAARTVSRGEDYSVRVAPGGQDEVGALIVTFNEMLERMQEHDRALGEARENLERRVEERTSELAKSRSLLAAAQRMAHVGSWEWDIPLDEITWSDEMYRLYGLDPAAGFEPSYSAFLERVHPEDREMVAARVARALEDGEPFNFEHRLVRPDGTVRTLSAYGTVERGEDGRPRRLVGTAQDITERKAAEEERAQLIREQAGRAEAEAARRRSAFLAEAGGTLAHILDPRGTLSAVARLVVPDVADWCMVLIAGGDGASEPLACAHLDPSKEDALGQLARRAAACRAATQGAAPAQLFFAPQEFSPFTDPESRSLLCEVGYSSGMRISLQARNRCFGELALGTVGRPLTADDLDLVRSLADRAALFTDNARLLREAQQANRLKDEFLATLSHELRTPLNAIVGWTKLLKGGELDEAGRVKAVDTIDRNASAQAQLIEDILDVSRIVAGKFRLKPQPTDLVAVTEGALDSVRHSAEAKGIRLHADVGPVKKFNGDPDRLRQVVSNLLSNAIKFTPKGGNVWISVAEADGHVQIQVKDDGAGIKPEFLGHVFERFRQADSSTTRQHTGLGLGLAIVRHLVELHGGNVSVASEGEGRGATFTVRLPLAGGRPEAAPAEGRHGELAPRLHGVEVLLVEDQQDARDLIRTMLEHLGARVTAVGSAGEALEQFRDRPPDVLLSDLEMPGEDGYELMRRVRALPPQHGGRVPSAALTAFARPEDRAKALAAGFQFHLSKPVAPEQLAATVAELVGRRD